MLVICRVGLSSGGGQLSCDSLSSSRIRGPSTTGTPVAAYPNHFRTGIVWGSKGKTAGQGAGGQGVQPISLHPP